MISLTDIMYGFGQILRGELPTALVGALSGTATGATRADARAHALAFANVVLEDPYHFQVEEHVVSDELVDRVDDPDLVQNGSLNMCGPAAFTHLYCSRDPMGYVKYVLGLYTQGRGLIGKADASDIGGITVEPGWDLREVSMYGTTANPQEFQNNYGLGAVDFIALASLRDDQNWWFDFESPQEELAGITLPEEVSSWLTATGLYSSVSNEGGWFINRDAAHAKGLSFDPAKRDILLLIQTWILQGDFEIGVGSPTINVAAANAVATTGTDFQQGFPNHYVVLQSPITETSNGFIDFQIWTWGDVRHFQVPKATFEANYYGAIVAELA